MHFLLALLNAIQNLTKIMLCKCPGQNPEILFHCQTAESTEVIPVKTVPSKHNALYEFKSFSLMHLQIKKVHHLLNTTISMPINIA